MTSNRRRCVLALGADTKNRFLVGCGRKVEFGPDVGNLEEASNYELFRREVQKAVKRIQPFIVLYDMHPAYFSTLYAKSLSAATQHIPVQHHHAHIASVLYEHGLKEPVIGVSLDGTGFGTDGGIWGGEFLIVNAGSFERAGHFKYIRMPGGEKAIYEPWRMALSILGRKAAGYLSEPGEEDKEAVLEVLSKGINSPFTSSAGRLFDAAAALLGICEYASFEAEGPIKLEGMCDDAIARSYGFDIIKEKDKYIIDMKKAFLQMSADIGKNKKRGHIATKFHNTMAQAVSDLVFRISKEKDINNVALSGGVFQNKFLKKNVMAKLLSGGLNVFINERTPVNDLNISLGQYHVSCGSGKN